MDALVQSGSLVGLATWGLVFLFIAPEIGLKNNQSISLST